jgi:DNA repair exonuclease SbcCD nuclease subunit
LKFVHTADTHLGFEISRTVPKDLSGRCRRGDAVVRNFQSVVQHALDEQADLFIHSGDLFHKYYIPREKLDDLVRPILDLNRSGIPVAIIPGNHERSRFPFDLFHGASGVYVFDRPKTVCLALAGWAIGLAGFPFIRQNSRRGFFRALAETEYEHLRSDVNILVTHQAFDNAVVGPNGYTFTAKRCDTVSRRDCPVDFDYVAAGHIHRYQELPHPIQPHRKFVYPGSIQRMSFAEKDEVKGFVQGELTRDRVETYFVPLPSHPMEIIEIEAAGWTARYCEETICDHLFRLEDDTVVRFQLTGGSATADYPDVDFQMLRSRMPRVMECHFALRVKNRWVVR